MGGIPDERAQLLAPELGSLLGVIFNSERETGELTNELAGRYEEIDLLYAISEILGHTLQLKEAASGLRFEQPVLDTLLLSAWLQPNQESHRLEAIAERMGVAVTGRHTALGDATVTAEVFLRQIALLQAKGVHTLGQARAAALQTYQARLRY